MSLYTLLQITDSLFPSGSFAHSAGLEALFDGRTPSATEIGTVVASTFDRHLLRTDGLLGLRAHRAACAGDLLAVIAADHHLLAAKLTRELRESSLATGRSFLEAACSVITDPALALYTSCVARGDAPGNYAIAFQVVAAKAAIGEKDSLSAWAYQAVAQLTAACMRLGLLGHRGAQQILGSLRVTADRSVDALLVTYDLVPSSFSPLLEIASMRHERQYTRLFRS